MAYTFDQFRQVLRKAGFQLIRSGKHEVWAKAEPDGTVNKVPISHQHGRGLIQVEATPIVAAGIMLAPFVAYLVNVFFGGWLKERAHWVSLKGITT